MTANMFTPQALVAMGQAYPNEAVRLTHTMLDHPLLGLDALEALASSLPAACVEYNPGALPIGIAPEDIPVSPLGIAETVRTIDRNGSWMVIKRIEQHPAYGRLLHALLDELKDIVQPRTGAMERCEGFVFVTSPGSVTPFHFDPEHNILLQIRGSKTMTVFPADDEELIDPTVHEAFHLGGHHRNLPWQDEFGARGQPVEIHPGEAIYVPVKAPHWVQNGPEVSISLSVTWRSEWSVAEADARAFNHVLRQIGIAPRRPAAYPARNLAKSLAYRAVRRVKGPVAPT
ncbi:cupin-like domain-containing protein [Novosphingobium lentum]|uniref:cupin-like domain-containing protein n=1 Tax=Novosphingobium lentum TaxID=145287 RepID=UPI000A06383C|nr:cupin-like domain-containing protein [Novosphingobium lentum]